MPRYRVFVREIHVQPYEIVAESEEEAVQLVFIGQGELVEGTLEFSHFADKEDWVVEEIERDPILPSLLGEPRCRAKGTEGYSLGLICTRVLGHEGDHVAHGCSDQPLSAWPQEETDMEEEDICGFCGLPGADKIPHPIRWPDELSAGTKLVHAECEAVECARASSMCQGKSRDEFLRNCC